MKNIHPCLIVGDPDPLADNIHQLVHRLRLVHHHGPVGIISTLNPQQPHLFQVGKGILYKGGN